MGGVDLLVINMFFFINIFIKGKAILLLQFFSFEDTKVQVCHFFNEIFSIPEPVEISVLTTKILMYISVINERIGILYIYIY